MEINLLLRSWRSGYLFENKEIDLGLFVNPCSPSSSYANRHFRCQVALPAFSYFAASVSPVSSYPHMAG